MPNFKDVSTFLSYFSPSLAFRTWKVVMKGSESLDICGKVIVATMSRRSYRGDCEATVGSVSG